VIYEADCHTLKKDEVTDIKINDYFLWKERSLFDFKVSFEGASETENEYGFDAEIITTTISYEYVSSEVINNDRENKFPEGKDDGTFEIKTSSLFNLAGKYGKIKDSDLIRIKHNPCFDCSFTAWVTLRKVEANSLAKVRTENNDPPMDPPEKPDDSYDRWSIVRGPDLYYIDDGGAHFWSYLVNSGQRFTRTSSIKIHSGLIDSKTRNLGEVLTFDDWAHESEDSPNAKIKIGTYEYDGFVNGLEDGITAKVEWLPNRQRPA